MYYYRVYFRCNECGQVLTQIVKTGIRSKFDARDKIKNIQCHFCVSKESPEFFNIEELFLSHLEEFIKWSGESQFSLIETISNKRPLTF
jgi:hypothetical protein